MKRGLTSIDEDTNSKKPKVEEEGLVGFTSLDDNLLFEVFRHVDAKTLGTAACVSKQWHKTAEDERLWELMCTRHWANNAGNCAGGSNQQLRMRSVVLALGGFRRLHSLYIWPLTHSNSSNSSASSSRVAAAPVKAVMPAKSRWGKDEVNLSLSLLSIRFYEKMNYRGR